MSIFFLIQLICGCAGAAPLVTWASWRWSLHPERLQQVSSQFSPKQWRPFSSCKRQKHRPSPRLCLTPRGRATSARVKDTQRARHHSDATRSPSTHLWKGCAPESPRMDTQVSRAGFIFFFAKHPHIVSTSAWKEPGGTVRGSKH